MAIGPLEPRCTTLALGRRLDGLLREQVERSLLSHPQCCRPEAQMGCLQHQCLSPTGSSHLGPSEHWLRSWRGVERERNRENWCMLSGMQAVAAGSPSCPIPRFSAIVTRIALLNVDAERPPGLLPQPQIPGHGQKYRVCHGTVLRPFWKLVCSARSSVSRCVRSWVHKKSPDRMQHPAWPHTAS